MPCRPLLFPCKELTEPTDPMIWGGGGEASKKVPEFYNDFLDLEFPREKPKNPKNYPKLASDSSGTLKIGFSVKFYIYI